MIVYFACHFIWVNFSWQVNGQKLLGLNHVEVVGILKELPGSVRLVCGRRAPGAPPPLHPIDAPTADRDTFAARVSMTSWKSLFYMLKWQEFLVWSRTGENVFLTVYINNLVLGTHGISWIFITMVCFGTIYLTGLSFYWKIDTYVVNI